MKRKCAALSLETPCSTVPDLQPALWSSLPDEILEQVLARLPVDSLLRCRRTCRKYNSLIISGELHLALGPSLSLPGKNLPLWCNFSYESMTTFNSKRNLWSTMSLNFLNNDPQLGPRHECRTSMSVETAGGLICLTSKSSSYAERQTVTVCNPITKRCRQLLVPPSHPMVGNLEAVASKLGSAMYYGELECIYDYGVKLLGMVVDKQAYKVILAGNSNRQGYFQTIMIFDSATNSWESTDESSGAVSLSAFHRISSVVSCNGSLYFLESGLRTRDNRNPFMRKYDSDSKTWSKKFTVPKDTEGNPCLIVHRDELFCLARSAGKTKRMRGVSWIFYRFQEKKGELNSGSWVKVSAMPTEVYDELCQTMRPEDMTCVGQGDLVFFSSTTEAPELQLSAGKDVAAFKSPRTKTVMAHDFCRKTWSWLPEYCPLPDLEDDSDASHLTEFLSFEPSLMDV